MAENLVILVILAALAGASSLVLLNVLWRRSGRAFWGREGAIQRSHRRERRVFLVGVVLVLAMGVAWVVISRRTPACVGEVVIVRGPGGTPLECLCEKGRRVACFEAGP